MDGSASGILRAQERRHNNDHPHPTGPLVVEAQLNDSPTAQAIAAALPIKGKANTWGDEIYFRIPVSTEAMVDARAEMTSGNWRIDLRARLSASSSVRRLLHRRSALKLPAPPIRYAESWEPPTSFEPSPGVPR